MIRDLIVGVVGAFPGGWLFAVAFVVVGGGFFVSLLTAFVGAIVLRSSTGCAVPPTISPAERHRDRRAGSHASHVSPPCLPGEEQDG
jgi:hypothetical protein